MTNEKREVHPATKSRSEHREVLRPLIQYLRGHYTENYKEAAKRAGFDDWHRFRRIVNGEVASPSWVDFTKLLVASNISPNQAAGMVGLYAKKAPSAALERLLRESGLDARVIHLVSALMGSELGEDAKRQIIETSDILVTALLREEREWRGRHYRIHPSPHDEPLAALS